MRLGVWVLPRLCSGAGLEELAGGQGGVGASLSPLQRNSRGHWGPLMGVFVSLPL